MGTNRSRWFYSALAFGSVSPLALADAQGMVRLVRGAPDTLTLEVRGVAPAAVEVEIGGVVVAQRQLAGTTRGTLQIQLSNAGLPPGIHEATVKLYDLRGRLLTTLRGPIELTPDPTAPITILIPRHGTSVAGTVPIEVRVSGQSRPYVSFFVDGQVRTLRNYPPYVYYWDTTRERNGWHTIEAWSFDGTQTFKSPPTRVLVKNPGGRTERQLPAQSDEQVGLNEPTLALPAPAPASSTGSLRTPEAVMGQALVESRLSRPPATADSEPRASRPMAPPQDALTITTPLQPPSASYRAARTEAQPGDASRLSVPPVESAPPVATGVPTEPMAAQSQLRSVQGTPRMRGQKLATPSIALAPAPAVRAPARTSWLTLTPGTRLPATITHCEVLLDARPVVFDVAPRVQNGIPLIAVRQVFEQAGGKLSWDNQRKVATIELAGKQLVLDVRANRAVLNGEAVPLDASLQIVNGRILVPASLLGKALNADLAFDMEQLLLHINTR